MYLIWKRFHERLQRFFLNFILNVYYICVLYVLFVREHTRG